MLERFRNVWASLQHKAALVKNKAGVKRSVAIVFVASLALVIFYWNSASTPKINGARLYEVKKTSFTRKITQPGELKALNSATISAPRDGTITYLAPEGTLVKPGDVLVRFDPSEYQRVLDENTAALRVAQADLRKAQKDVDVEREKQRSEVTRLRGENEGVQIELNQMERKRGLLQELAEKGFITKSTFEENELNYLKTKIRLEQSKVALETARRNSKPTLEAIQTGVERHKANVQKAEQLIANARADLKDAEIVASQAGLVVYAPVSSSSPEKIYEGLVTFRRRSLIFLPDISQMVVETQVNEIDIKDIKKGGPGNITVEAYPGEVFKGKVLQIGALAKPKRDPSGTLSRIRVFDVTVSVEEKDSRLKPGLTAAVDLIVDRLQDVIAVPVGAVNSERGQDFVIVSNGRKVEKRKVVLGPSNENSVVVKQGLKPGERILLGAFPPRS